MDNETIYLHGFKFSNIRIKPPTFDNDNEIKFPNDARKNHLNYFATVVADIVQKYFPDWRRVLNELQRYSAAGSIDVGILNANSSNVDDLMKDLKSKKFGEVRKWVNANLDSEPSMIFRSIYDGLYSNLEGPAIAQAILLIAKYQYQAAFVADQEINTLACLTEIMVECF